ncbi:UNVERIFIED_CONTAM: Desiccation-related protein PCC13-62 [Sesamum radiatum]|uniref:Desiccation-related protein PCC13-62 n=1 Tax=Sesamum radiatum TaxID=300843 RepID=A0AAW2QJL4_SESRA
MAPNLTMGGPPPVGGRRANLSPLVRDIIAQFALQEFGHLRAIQNTLVAGLLGVESGQDAVIRTLLYERASFKVLPYGFTVAEFTNKISNLRNRLGKEGVQDEGLIVEPAAGAEGRISGNVLSADKDSLSYARTPEEVLRIVWERTGERDGGILPQTRSYLLAGSTCVLHQASIMGYRYGCLCFVFGQSRAHGIIINNIKE